ncbi:MULTISPECIES: helix-turn-helix domain-containing protein [unclassified Gordonia (in: high G+C Gram-positive bacteria)]|uniref:helix-turn-helix domain-containing protein n=1 Tax=unclassified Gordonia (in: high G+C Gram-positive bacteria) TaxID=2657482 RepID=UPI0009AC14A5|nr:MULTISPECIES: helix-turn-helix domain-containing protein [unclassified Gordonia (in: high G+C Gram-positive bacteria)]MDF3281363.1 helix-turn-helix domain-containing protein [Gordonia sp. N1V]OPX09994.1 hypothetical protein B1964_24155 [Gordonia sp. i37]
MTADRETFTERLNALFERRERTTGRSQTLNEFLNDFEAVTGTRVSKGYLSELRNGVVTDPRMALIQAFAEYFQVPTDYFFGGAETATGSSAAKADLIRALTDAGARVGLRAGGLSDESLNEVTRIIDRLREKEGLMPVTDRDHPGPE